jgi:hypothetical protein
MKYLITITFTLLVLTLNAGVVLPISGGSPIVTEAVELSVDASIAKLFKKAEFNNSKGCLSFILEGQIEFIQIVNAEGELKYQLPVFANSVNICKKIFPGEGEFKLGFMIDGQSEVQFTDVTVK